MWIKARYGVQYRGQHLNRGGCYEVDDRFGALLLAQGRAVRIEAPKPAEKPKAVK